MTDLAKMLHELPSPPAPERFAADVASQIAFSARVGILGNAHPPPDFAAQLAAKIATNALDNPLLKLKPVKAPADFATQLAVKIAADANPLAALEPRRASRQFAPLLAARISSQANWLAALPQVNTPPNFAARVATRIAADSEHDRTPLYFLGVLLSGIALAFLSLTWRDAQAAGVAMFEVMRSLPETLLLPVTMVAVFAVTATIANRVMRFPAAVAAFMMAAVFVVPQLSGWFGNTRVGGSVQLASVVRFAGDVTVAGEVRGDVIAIGGSVRLERGARVSGRVLTFLGDVSLPEGSSANAISAVLGNVSGGTRDKNQKSINLPGLSAASALRPIGSLMAANTWQWWYLGLLGVLAGTLVLLPHIQKSLEQPFVKDAGRSIGLGLLLVFLTVPVVALGGLSVLGTPLALVLGVFTVLAFSSGAAITMFAFGKGLQLRGFWVVLPGLALFAPIMLLPAVAIVVWLLAGAWGAGALLLAIRQGAFIQAVSQSF